MPAAVSSGIRKLLDSFGAPKSKKRFDEYHYREGMERDDALREDEYYERRAYPEGDPSIGEYEGSYHDLESPEQLALKKQQALKRKDMESFKEERIVEQLESLPPEQLDKAKQALRDMMADYLRGGKIGIQQMQKLKIEPEQVNKILKRLSDEQQRKMDYAKELPELPF